MNLSVDSELLAEARRAQLSLSAIFEAALRDRVAESRRTRWLAENEEALQAYNASVDRDGVFGDGRRSF